jgi:hypothetical protein
LDGSTSFDIQKDLEILTLIVTNITKITKFHHLNIWSQSDCIDLMNWHVKHERHFRRGVNNNLSLYNYDISEGETTYSLLNFRIDLFVPSVMVICPFKAYSDVRGIIRLSTTFHSLKADSRLFDRNGNEYNHKIRRYRLNWILSCPKFDIDSSIDIHHKNGLKSILYASETTITDDRFTNLVSLRRDVHSAIHIMNGDDKFVDM